MSDGPAHDVQCVYNDRSELTESHRYDDLYGQIPAARRLYDYDNIGNRETDTEGAATTAGMTKSSTECETGLRPGEVAAGTAQGIEQEG